MELLTTIIRNSYRGGEPRISLPLTRASPLQFWHNVIIYIIFSELIHFVLIDTFDEKNEQQTKVFEMPLLTNDRTPPPHPLQKILYKFLIIVICMC